MAAQRLADDQLRASAAVVRDIQPWELHPPVILPELIRQLRVSYPDQGEALEQWLRRINALAVFYAQDMPGLLAENAALRAQIAAASSQSVEMEA